MMMVESLLKFPPCLLAGQTANAAPTDMLLLSLLHNRRDIQKHALKKTNRQVHLNPRQRNVRQGISGINSLFFFF